MSVCASELRMPCVETPILCPIWRVSRISANYVETAAVQRRVARLTQGDSVNR